MQCLHCNHSNFCTELCSYADVLLITWTRIHNYMNIFTTPVLKASYQVTLMFSVTNAMFIYYILTSVLDTVNIFH